MADTRVAPRTRRPPRTATVAPTMDAVTARAVERMIGAPPHLRLLALADCTLSEFAKRMTPQISRSRLRDVFAQAEGHGRLTYEWAGRLGRAVDASPEAILTLFRIETPAVRGRPRTRRTA